MRVNELALNVFPNNNISNQKGDIQNIPVEEEDDEFEDAKVELEPVATNKGADPISSQQSTSEDENDNCKFKLTKKELKQVISDSTEKQLLTDIIQVEVALDLFLDSKFNEAENILKKSYGKSLYFTLGYGVIRMLKAVMTFDPEDIRIALEALKLAQELGNILRKAEGIDAPPNHTPSSSQKKWTLSGLLGLQGNKEGQYLLNLTQVQRHSELVAAEAQVLRATLSMITQTNLVAFVKEGLAIRSSYNTIKVCLKFLERTYEEDGGLEAFEKYGLDEHFISGVTGIAGMFNLTLSLLPAKALKLFELIGFSGDREFALSRLEISARWPLDSNKSRLVPNDFKPCFPMPAKKSECGGLRKPMSDLILLAYHLVLSSMICLPDCNLPLAELQLEEILSKRSNSFIFLALKARMLQTKGLPAESEAQYLRVMNIQKDWTQLIHMCLWDLGNLRAIQGKWKEASDAYSTLFKESKWSVAIYRYLEAICLYSIGNSENNEKVATMLKELPKLTKKIAGKSLPMEKFVCRKARKFFKQNQRLLIPGLEIYYFLGGLEAMDTPNLLRTIALVDKEIKNLESQESASDGKLPYPTFYDDLCLTRFVKAVLERERVFPKSKTLIGIKEQVLQGKQFKSCLTGESLPEKFINLEQKPTDSQISTLKYSLKNFEAVINQSSEVELDHWMLAFSRYEVGSLYMRCGIYEKAKKEFEAALNGGKGEDDEVEVGKANDGVKSSMESNLNIKCHNALIKLNCLELMEKRLDSEK
ncbi:hypothetical protein HDU92_004842 [Lobulomyces angularis]|nr:hypothetical protein HDU92_004842 [Lobulomyces angularis]